MITLPLPSLEATKALAEQLAPLLKAGDVIALHGGLGAGKTTFSRALISALIAQETDVPSPTYTLVQTYEAPDFPIFHFDLYRLDDPDDVFELGWDETQDGLALIEWPDRAGRHLPGWRLDLTLDLQTEGGAETRTATLEPHGEDWQKRLHGF
jgi:tRNA threonylcarbamoyl adenosine modification protein YjeE